MGVMGPCSYRVLGKQMCKPALQAAAEGENHGMIDMLLRSSKEPPSNEFGRI